MSIKGGIYLGEFGEIKIILKKAKLQFTVFQILMEAHSHGCLHPVPRNLTVKQIIDELEKMNMCPLDAEKKIRKAIHTIRKNIEKRYGANIGNEIVESSENGGYQIGAKVALIFGQKT